MGRAALAFLLAASTAVLAGCSSPPEAADPFEVEVDDDHFEPEGISIGVGETVTFQASSSAEDQHTVTIHKASDPPASILLDVTVRSGDHAAFEFGEAGDYHVWCRFHGTMTSGMHMLVTVE